MSTTCEAPNVLSANYYEQLPVPAAIEHSITDLVFDDITYQEVIAFVLNTANHICLLLMLILISWKCFSLRLEKTAMHAFLCTLGFIFLTAEGMMVRYVNNPVTYIFGKSTRHSLHITLLLAGSVLGLAGTVHKMVTKKKHFHTTHGKFGLATCLYCIANICMGLGVYFGDNDQIDMELLTICHNLLGIIAFFMSAFSQYYGYDSGFFRRNFDNPKHYKIMMLLVLVLTIMGPIRICSSNVIKYTL